MIETITLIYGPEGSKTPLTFKPGNMTIFVGPNNSGKSLILNEIELDIRSNQTRHGKILSDLKIIPFSDSELASLIDQIKKEPGLGEWADDENVIIAEMHPISGQKRRFQVRKTEAVHRINAQNDLRYLKNSIIACVMIKLDGKTRLQLVDSKPSSSVEVAPTNHLVALFQDNDARKRIRDITFDAFGLYFSINPLDMTTLRIDMSNDTPADFEEEKSLDLKGKEFHQKCISIDELGDGIKAFTGLVAALLATNYKLILIDEPEAFMHPPLARKLGFRLATLAKERSANVFVSTHDENFLMGCIEAGKDIDIMRLTYNSKSKISTTRKLESNELKDFMKKPILRSTNLLSALFHFGAIVCEGDSDRVLYQEINNRLLAFNRDGIRDSIFLNAHNKQTTPTVSKPLRQIGIPSAIIVDLDIIKISHEFKEIMKASFVPEETARGLGQTRGEIYRKFEAKKIDPSLGRGNLSEQECESLDNLLEALAEYGIFVVPNGSLESWLPNLRVTAGNKPEWVIEIFKKLGSDPENEAYIMPAEGDIWDFIKQIGVWLSNDKRKGMPM